MIGVLQRHVAPRSSPRRTAGRIGLLLGALFLFSTFANLAGLATIVFALQVFDRVLPSRSFETLIVLGIIAGALLVMHGVLTTVRQRFADRMGERILFHHEEMLVEHSVRRMWDVKRTTAQSPLQDLDSIARAIRGGALNAAFDLPWSALFLLALWLIAPPIGLCAAIVASVLGLIVLAVSWRRSPSPSEGKKAIKRHWEEALANRDGPVIATMRSLSERVVQTRRGVRGENRDDRETNQNARGATAALRHIGRVAILSVGAWILIQGEGTPGIMVASMMLTTRIFSPIEGVLRERKTIVKGLTSLRRLRASIASMSKLDTVTDNSRVTGALRVVELSLPPVSNLRRAITNIDFTLHPGSALLVTGSGSTGKSLLLRALAGLDEPRSGTLRLGEARFDRIPSALREQLVGYLPQENVFLTGTIAEAIARYDSLVPLSQIVDAAKQVDAHELILKLPDAYETRLPPEGVSMSFSLARSIGLARAICHRPHVLLLDEPTAGLDTNMTTVVAELIRQQCATGRLCVVASSSPLLADITDCALLLHGEGGPPIYGPTPEVLAAQSGDMLRNASCRRKKVGREDVA